MAKLLLLLCSAAALLVVMAAGFQQKQLRCSDTNSYGEGLFNYGIVCLANIPKINSPKTTPQWNEKLQNPAKMLDFIEFCTCTLLSMTMVWETMLTHGAEMLFATSRDLVENFDGDMAKDAKTNPLFAGDDGDSLYHYYVLSYMVKNARSPTQLNELFKKIMKKTASIYFDLEHLESPYKNEENFPLDHTLTLLISGTCKELSTNFGPYWESLSMMRNGFDNEMWMYRVVSHDETLYKLVISSMLCKVVDEYVDEKTRATAKARG